MRPSRFPLLLSLAAALASCGGGGGSTGGGGGISSSGGGSSGGGTSACSLRSRQDWVLSQINEWYLFPSMMASGVNPAAYGDVQGYIDALVAPARAASQDRYFTYITSIAEENAYFNSGSSAGFGIRLNYDSVGRRLFVIEAFEGAPALGAGIDRGVEILAIGTSAGTMKSVSSLFNSGGAAAVSDALGPSDPGVTRVLQISDGTAVSTVTVTKANYSIEPVSTRYGAKVIDDGGRKVGYVNLRTFINTAEQGLRDAFAQFRAQGVTEVIVDLRYNGGGLVSIAELMGDLLNAGRAPNVFSYTTFRASKSTFNETRPFANQPQAIAATRIAFIGTGSSASASELVINAQTPYLNAASALIGTNTYGKPVGQIGLDQAACDDRLRVVAFRTENANHQGDYYTGLAGKVGATCQAADDISKPLGDPQEASVRAALDFLAGRTCTPITTTGTGAQKGQLREPLLSTRPSASQYELPGLF